MANESEKKPGKLDKVLEAVRKAAENPVVQAVAAQLFKKLIRRK